MASNTTSIFEDATAKSPTPADAAATASAEASASAAAPSASPESGDAKNAETANSQSASAASASAASAASPANSTEQKNQAASQAPAKSQQQMAGAASSNAKSRSAKPAGSGSGSSSGSRSGKGKGRRKGPGPAAALQSLGQNIGKDLSAIGGSLAQQGSALLSSYDDVLRSVGDSTGIKFAPVMIPLRRRRQTLAVLFQSTAFFLAVVLNFVAWRYWTGVKFWLYLLYLSYKLMYQTFHKDGGLPIPWFRGMAFWKWFNDFFPVTLHKTVDLDKTESTSYIFGYHPHGIIGMGAWATFATVGASGFTKLFPNVDVRLLTLRLNFYVPFFDLFLTFMGVCDASRESCNAILGSEDTKSLALVLGGAKESLDAHPGKVILYLKDRKGFVKIALEHGASLVPVFGFGENELFSQVSNPQGSLVRKVQDTLQRRLGFALPIFRGRGVFQYNFGLLPRRIPINVLFGEPIACPKTARGDITPEQLNKYHAEYMMNLKKLFDDSKAQFYKQGTPPELQFR